MKLIKLKQEELEVGKEVYILGYIGKHPKLVKRKYTITSEDMLNPTRLSFYKEKTNRVKTISKNFYDDEIICKLADGSIYLKTGVKRKFYGDDLDYDSMDQITKVPTVYKALEKTVKIIEDEQNFN